jgi:hypothetical protein
MNDMTFVWRPVWKDSSTAPCALVFISYNQKTAPTSNPKLLECAWCDSTPPLAVSGAEAAGAEVAYVTIYIYSRGSFRHTACCT